MIDTEETPGLGPAQHRPPRSSEKWTYGWKNDLSIPLPKTLKSIDQSCNKRQQPLFNGTSSSHYCLAISFLSPSLITLTQLFSLNIPSHFYRKNGSKQWRLLAAPILGNILPIAWRPLLSPSGPCPRCFLPPVHLQDPFSGLCLHHSLP